MLILKDDGTIAITRGDTGSFRYTPRFSVDNAVAVFSVKTVFARDDVIVKLLEQNEDGTLTVNLDSADTDLPSGAYVYDIRYLVNPVFDKGDIINAEQIITPDEPGVFLILDAVTDFRAVVIGGEQNADTGLHRP